MVQSVQNNEKMKFEYIKVMVWRALEDGLGIMIGGDMNALMWEVWVDVCMDGRGMKKAVSASALDREK